MKNIIFKTVGMLLVITILVASFAPVASYATSKTAITKVSVAESKTATKNESIESKTSKGTIETTKITGNTLTNNAITNTEIKVQTKTLSKAYDQIREDTETIKEIEEKPISKNGLENLNVRIESTIYKNYSEVETVEVGSIVVDEIYLKNTSNRSKELQVRFNIDNTILGGNTYAAICIPDYNVQDSEESVGLIEQQRVDYRGLITVLLNPNEEKVVKFEQEITRYKTNTIENTFLIMCEESVMELKDVKTATNKVEKIQDVTPIENTDNGKYEKEEPKKGTTEDIVSYFENELGSISFEAYNKAGTTLGTYGRNNIGQEIKIPFNGLFKPTNDMFCLNMGISYYQDLKINNLYTIYNSDIYRYVNGSLIKDDFPSDGIGIGDSYNNLITEKYNQLSYILSELETYSSPEFYASLGITYTGERPDHSLSPVQVAIWKLEGIGNSTIINKLRNRLGKIGITNISRQNTIINSVLDYATILYANAESYNNYVVNGKTCSIPNMEFTYSGSIETNGKLLVGPFIISYPIEQVEATYTNVQGTQITKTGLYGDLQGVAIQNNSETYRPVDSQGNYIDITQISQGQLEFYIDITGKNFDEKKETVITISVNNQYRQAYFFTLDSYIYHGQNIIVGIGTKSLGEYNHTFEGIVEVEKITLSGKVWLDIQHGIKGEMSTREIKPPNGILDEDEERITGIEVILVNNNTNQIEKTTTTNNNGDYVFQDVEKAEYSILLGYEGVHYIVSEAGIYETDDTKNKVAESIMINGTNIRTDFAGRFNPITGNKHILKQYSILQNGDIETIDADYIMQYNIYGPNNHGLYTSELITSENNQVIPVYKMFAKTVETYENTANNINMALKLREGNLSLTMDMSDAKLRSGIVGLPETIPTSKNEDDTFITYEIGLHNRESDLASVNGIIVYFSRDLEFVDANGSYFLNGTYHDLTNLQGTLLGTITINGKIYNKMKIVSTGALVDGGMSTYINAKFKLLEGASPLETFTAYSEIESYSILGGLVDSNSAPDNGITVNGTILREDDFSYAETTRIRDFMLKELLAGLVPVRP